MTPELHRPLAKAPTAGLLQTLVQDSKQLVQTEVQLMRAELMRDVKRELRMVEGLGIAAVCVLCTLNLLLTALVLGLAPRVMPDWAAALVVASGVLAVGAVAGLIGWSLRVKEPLPKTRKTLETLKEDVRWAKERMA